MYEVIAYTDSTESYSALTSGETLEAVYAVIEREGCSWHSAAECDADYNIYLDGEWVEGWY